MRAQVPESGIGGGVAIRDEAGKIETNIARFITAAAAATMANYLQLCQVNLLLLPKSCWAQVLLIAELHRPSRRARQRTHFSLTRPIASSEIGEQGRERTDLIYIISLQFLACLPRSAQMVEIDKRRRSSGLRD